MSTSISSLDQFYPPGRKTGVIRFTATESMQRYRKRHPEKYQYSHIRYKTEFPVRYLLSLVKRRSKSKNIECNIEESDIIIPEYCPLLQIKLDLLGNIDNHPSVDRINPKQGYIKDNVMIISHRANRIKSNASWEELQLIAENLRRVVS